MNISLRRFLKTGELGLLHIGLTGEEVEAILGPPENTAKTTRKFRFPNICLYGGVEVWLDQSSPQVCTGIWIESMGHGWRDEFKMPDGSVVEDWGLQPYLSREEVEGYLQQNDIAVFQPEPKKVGRKGEIFAPRHLIVRSSGVTLCFDEQWQLLGFHASLTDFVPQDIP